MHAYRCVCAVLIRVALFICLLLVCVYASAFVPTNPHHAALAKEEWHFKTAEDTANFLQTHIDMKMPNSSRGLTSEEAAKHLVMYGFNQLTPPKTVCVICCGGVFARVNVS
jgi:hypothetical protein